MNPGSPVRCPLHRRSFSRRQFVGATAGLALSAGASTAYAERNPHSNAAPMPIPGGVSPFGILIHHFPVGPTGTPLANITDPSQITDFNGFVGLNRIRGVGVGTGLASPTFQADMGFMVGEYIAVDGKHYNASFGFIWLDVFNGPVGSNQVHDYNPHIASNGLFWTIPVPNDSVTVALGKGHASFQLALETFDDHDLQSSLTKIFPAGFPQLADVTFAVEWSGILDHQHVRNDALNFEGDFFATGSTIEWSSFNPASGFSFTSEPANPARLVGAVMGRERSGVFFK